MLVNRELFRDDDEDPCDPETREFSCTRDDRVTPCQQHTVRKLASLALVKRGYEIRSTLQEEPAVAPFVNKRRRRWRGVRFAYLVP